MESALRAPSMRGPLRLGGDRAARAAARPLDRSCAGRPRYANTG